VQLPVSGKDVGWIAQVWIDICKKAEFILAVEPEGERNLNTRAREKRAPSSETVFVNLGRYGLPPTSPGEPNTGLRLRDTRREGRHNWGGGAWSARAARGGDREGR